MMTKRPVGIVLYTLIVFNIVSCTSHQGYNSPDADVLMRSQDLLNRAPQSIILREYAQTNASSSPSGEPFCTATILWEDQVREDEKIVYAHVFCLSVSLLDGELQSSAGGIFGGPLFRLQKLDGGWQVVDYDKRESPSIEPEPWIAEYERLVPEHVKVAYLDRIIHHANFVNTAAKFYQLDAPTYAYEFCSVTEPCETGFICIQHGPFNQGQNKCLKSCSVDQECGLGHACRPICANGQNGCPDTSVLACQPDLLRR